MNQPWRIEMLGTLQVGQGGETVIRRFRSHKIGSLLAYLALFPRRKHSREELIELFWPEVELAQGRPSLSVALSSLRQQLEPPGVPSGTVLITDREFVQMNAPAFRTDVAEFENYLVQAGRVKGNAADALLPLLDALALYRGDLLPGRYDDWAISERERLAEAHRQALGQVTRYYTETQDYEHALRYARRLVQADPLREESYQDMMRLQARLGQGSAALQEFRRLETLLKEQLGARPSAATLQLVREIEKNLGTEGPPVVLPNAAPLPPPLPELSVPEPEPAPPPAKQEAHLPLLFSRFVGREADLNAVAALLSDDACRLLTLVGPGGIGKTRLSVEVARRLAPHFQEAVWFVPLASLTDGALLLETVAAALGHTPTLGGDPLAQIGDVLGNGPALLIFDNLEQIVEQARAPLNALRTRFPALRMLTTSRRVLGLGGEQTYRVAPLAVPEMRPVDTSESLAQLAQVESIRLFIDRAQAVKPDFQLTPHNAAPLTGLCRRLEGIPLAIELAAARTQSLTPAQMLDRLAEKFDLLASRQTDREERHRTLRNAVDWSFDLLTSEQAAFFRHLCVFEGSWTLEAAEAVTDEPLALDYLTDLLECSLLYQTDANEDNGDSLRFGMLGVLNTYGREQVAPAEREQDAARHADWYAAFAADAAAHLSGPGQERWLSRLAIDHENLQAALEYRLAQPEREAASQLTIDLAEYWERRGHFRLARTNLARVLALWDVAPPSVLHGRLLNLSGWLAHLQGESAQAQAEQKNALRIFDQVGDADGQAVALNNLALLAQSEGRLGEALSLYEQSLALIQQTGGDPLKQANRLSNLGMLLTEMEEYAAAARRLEEALRIYRRATNPYGMAACLCNLGELALCRARPDEAAAFSDQALALFRQMEDASGIAHALANRAEAVVQAGTQEENAAPLLAEGLAFCESLGLLTLAALFLDLAAQSCLQHGDLPGAADAFAAADLLREEINGPRRAARQEASYQQVQDTNADALTKARSRLMTRPVAELLALFRKQFAAAS